MVRLEALRGLRGAPGDADACARRRWRRSPIAIPTRMSRCLRSISSARCGAAPDAVDRARAHRQRSRRAPARRAAGIAPRTRWWRWRPRSLSAAPRCCRSSPARASGSCGSMRHGRRRRSRRATRWNSSRATRTTMSRKRRSAGCASWPATTPTRFTWPQLVADGIPGRAGGGARARRHTASRSSRVPGAASRVAAPRRRRARQLARRARRRSPPR